MHRIRRFRVILLGLVVILITFLLFIALPGIVPDVNTFDGEKLTWGCTYYGIPPEIWDTWMWDIPYQPDELTWIATLLGDKNPNRTGALKDIYRTALSKGLGKLELVPDPDDENRVIISGYLQYGVFPDADNLTDNTTIQIGGSVNITREVYLLPGEIVLGAELVKDYPLPVLYGVLPRRDVTITLTNYLENKKTTENFKVRTDASGYFTASVEPDSDAVYYTVVAGFEAETIVPKPKKAPLELKNWSDKIPPPDTDKEPVRFYFQTETYYTTFAIEPGRFQFDKNTILLMIVGLVVLGGLSFYFWYSKNRIVYSQLVEIKEVENDTKRKVPVREKPDMGGDISQIEIIFTDIDNRLPAVWGVGEPVAISVFLKNKHGEILILHSCEIDTGDGEIIPEVSNDGGEISVLHLFTSRNEYDIKAGYKENSGKEVSTWRMIRIVDYREEIVRLFNELLSTVDIEQVTVDSEMTAREMEKMLNEKLMDSKKGTISEMISVFEEANYSTHPVDRESYLRMYRAVEEVTGND